MSLRINRVSEQILHELNAILRKDYREESTFITLVGAIVSADLKFARVKFSVIGDSASASKFMSSHRHFLKQKLAKRLGLKSVVELRFELTHAMESGNHLIDLLEEIKNETPE